MEGVSQMGKDIEIITTFLDNLLRKAKEYFLRGNPSCVDNLDDVKKGYLEFAKKKQKDHCLFSQCCNRMWYYLIL